jgi:dipeptidyl aminopeptidase/acylaminoacyl peptidase
MQSSRHLLRWGWVLGSLLWAVTAGAQAAPTPPIPAAAFYGPPQIHAAALSPSGRWLALTTGAASGRIGLAVFDLKAWKPLTMAANLTDADVGEFHWVNDDRLVFSLTDRQRGGGDQRFWPGLFSVRYDGTELRQLVKFDDPFFSARRTGPELLGVSHDLMHVPAGGGDEVIVGEWRYDGQGEFDTIIPKRLNVVTGRALSLAIGAPPNVGYWLFDHRGEPRVAVSRRGGRSTVHWRGPGADGWQVLSEHPSMDAPFTPAFVDNSGALFVTVSRGAEGTSVLKRFDFATGKPEAEPMVSTPGFDVRGGLISETAGDTVLGVRVVTDAETTIWFDRRLAALQQEADRRLPGHVNRLVCRRCSEPDMTVLVYAFSDRDPGQFWIYRAQDESWRRVSERREAIDPKRMARVEFERIKARDGLEIPVWLTIPPGPRDTPRPAVLLVHGGPWLRHGQWRWDDDAQFLASRGYVVIEPEFRGSTGYGQKLYRAGWRQWGQAMQDDLADALAWATTKGLVDGKRVCIAGASYGGYATLMGLVRHPELFRCGVAWVGVTDPRLMFQWRWGYDVGVEGREHSYPTLIGDPVKDAAMLDSVSPVLLADRIKAPLLLAYGGEDRRVPLVHGTRMRDALTAAGRPPQWVVYSDEGHGWYKLENQLDFARRMEDFLARHLR